MKSLFWLYRHVFAWLMFAAVLLPAPAALAQSEPYCVVSGAAVGCFSSPSSAASWSWSMAGFSRDSRYSYEGIMVDYADWTGIHPGIWSYYSFKAGEHVKREGPFALAKIDYRSCAAGQTWFADVGRCVPVDQLPPTCDSNPGTLGKSCPACGAPINPGTGNMWHVETDYRGQGLGGITLARVYNSHTFTVDTAGAGGFGAHWSTPYHVRIAPAAPFGSNVPPTVCYRRQDTGQIWCQTPNPPAPGPIPVAVTVSRRDGKQYTFNRGGREYKPEPDVADHLTASFNADGTAVVGWTYEDAGEHSVERFDVTGKLLSIEAQNGTVQQLTYSTGNTNDTSAERFPATAPVCSNIPEGAILPAGFLLCVTDAAGRQVQFEYDATGRIKRMLDPALQATTYAYDGPTGGCLPANPNSRACSAGNLVSVTYPNNGTRFYHFNEKSNVNGGKPCSTSVDVGPGFAHLLSSMTGLTDENGKRFISWTYDCNGKATSSELAGGAESVSLSYGAPAQDGKSTTTVTHALGTSTSPATTVRNFVYAPVVSSLKASTIDGPCVECGAFAKREYDGQGNVTSATDWNGAVTTYSYDLARNLETRRVEAQGTTSARTISTKWHPSLRLPVAIAEPLRITRFDYDPHGNLLTRTQTATNDTTGAKRFDAPLTGSARAWHFTYNAFGQLKSETGPRAKVPSVTSYDYDGLGNLTQITSPLGHVTLLTNYDAHGRVGRVTEANGRVTDYHYNERGWLRDQQVSLGSSTESTGFSYSPAGQLTDVSFPNGSELHFVYDDAQRLTQVSDNNGNRIVYTLDLLGHRTAEQSYDVNGTLARNISRVFNTLGWVQQTTGESK